MMQTKRLRIGFGLLVGGLLFLLLGAMSCNREEHRPITMSYLQGEWQGSTNGIDYTYRICEDSFFLKQTGLSADIDAADSCWDSLNPPVVFAYGQVSRGAFDVYFNGHYTNVFGEQPPECATALPDTFIRDYNAERRDGGLFFRSDLYHDVQLDRAKENACPLID